MRAKPAPHGGARSFLGSVEVEPDIKQLTEAGVGAAMIGTLIWCVRVALPKTVAAIHDQFNKLLEDQRKEMAELRQWHERQIDLQRQDCAGERVLFRASLDKFNETTLAIVQHDREGAKS